MGFASNLTQNVCCPNTELCTLLRFHTITNRNYYIKIIVVCWLSRKFGIYEFSTNTLFYEFIFCKNAFICSLIVETDFPYSSDIWICVSHTVSFSNSTSTFMVPSTLLYRIISLFPIEMCIIYL